MNNNGKKRRYVHQHICQRSLIECMWKIRKHSHIEQKVSETWCSIGSIEYWNGREREINEDITKYHKLFSNKMIVANVEIVQVSNCAFTLTPRKISQCVGALCFCKWRQNKSENREREIKGWMWKERILLLCHGHNEKSKSFTSLFPPK